ncbi:MAG: hypothetical protein JWN78_2915 [Bacteroidota bacterium]|nr:hypothetical protein [Bacteroidota bacterium]
MIAACVISEDYKMVHCADGTVVFAQKDWRSLHCLRASVNPVRG